MRKHQRLLRAMTLATAKGPKCCCLTSSGLNRSTSEEIIVTEGIFGVVQYVFLAPGVCTWCVFNDILRV